MDSQQSLNTPHWALELAQVAALAQGIPGTADVLIRARAYLAFLDRTEKEATDGEARR